MDLASYLRKHKLKPARLAERAGVPASTVTRILNGDRRPRLDTAAKLSAATGGEVTVSDFLAAPGDNPAPIAEELPA